jgi:hypothetical protein
MMHPAALHHIVISSHWPHASLLLSMEAERWASARLKAEARHERTL